MNNTAGEYAHLVKPKWIISTKSPYTLSISFDFQGDYGLLKQWVRIVKTIPDRKFDGKKKVWIVPLGQIHNIEKSLQYHNIAYSLSSAEIKNASDTLKQNEQKLLNVKKYSGDPFCIPGLVTKPFNYQYTGIGYLIVAGSAILADDMGLGKTVSALAASLALKAQKVLIICPSTLRWNWEKEILKHLENASYVLIDGNAKKRKKLWETDAIYYITSYELMLRDKELIQAYKWDMIVLDEATKIKNHKAQTTKEAKELQATYKFALTGTPIENRLEELHSIMEWVRPGVFGSLYYFLDRYAIKDFFGSIIGYKPEGLAEIKHLVGPYILRRTKEEVLPELPPKLYENRVVEFTQAERRAYKQLTKEVMDDILEDIGGGAVHTLRCKQFTSYPPILGMLSDGPKVRELQSILEEDNDHKYLVFSDFAEIIKRLAETFNAPYIAGPVKKSERVKIIDAFNNDPKQKVLFSSGVGSYGVEITGADVVIHLDTPWNPAVKEQREDRSHRLGQTRPVNIIRLMVRNSVDDRIDRIIAYKMKLRDSILDDADYEPHLKRFTKNDWRKVLLDDEDAM